MLKVIIYTLGKVKEEWINEGISEYTKRMKKTLSIDWISCKTEQEMVQLLKKSTHYIALDINGKNFSSETFSSWLMDEFVKNHSRLEFVIGGPNGLSKDVVSKASHLISFSSFTFTNTMIRLFLTEQIYRALEIFKGSGYHK
ncbi:MAG: 23S rRNA (pseudouridine(1915)-N(3))-methyltransferase RlmH [Rhabdochlamydiaceae bacterium]